MVGDFGNLGEIWARTRLGRGKKGEGVNGEVRVLDLMEERDDKQYLLDFCGIF